MKKRILCLLLCTVAIGVGVISPVGSTNPTAAYAYDTGYDYLYNKFGTIGYGYTTSGDGVKNLQYMLNRFNYNCGTVDGIFGPKTYNALIAFQRSNSNLVNDGICGRATWNYIARCYAN